MVLALIGYANTTGTCLSETIFYSDEEKINSAVNFAFEHYLRETKGLGYSGPEEYRDILKGCCKVGSGFVGDDMKWLYKFSGRLSDYVLVAKLPKDRVENAESHEINKLRDSLLDRDWFVIAVSNCGEAWDPFD